MDNGVLSTNYRPNPVGFIRIQQTLTLARRVEGPKLSTSGPVVKPLLYMAQAPHWDRENTSSPCNRCSWATGTCEVPDWCFILHHIYNKCVTVQSLHLEWKCVVQNSVFCKAISERGRNNLGPINPDAANVPCCPI